MNFLFRTAPLAVGLALMACTAMTEKPNVDAARPTTYRCTDGMIVQASYPTSETARLLVNGSTIEMKIAVSASGARYVSDSWQWWTKGRTEGMISRLAPSENMSSAPGVNCTAR